MMEWEDKDSKDESDLPDDGFVPRDDTSLDSDENLTDYVRRRWDRNAPGTSSFTWRKRENYPRRFEFTILGSRLEEARRGS